MIAGAKRRSEFQRLGLRISGTNDCLATDFTGCSVLDPQPLDPNLLDTEVVVAL